MTLADHTIVAGTPTLRAALLAAIEAFRPEHVLESGTHVGTGTTRLILEALRHTAASTKPEYHWSTFNSIECNANFCEQARQNLRGCAVNVIHGLSLTIDDAVTAVLKTNEYAFPDHVLRDHANNEAYLREMFDDGRPVLDGAIARLLPLPRPLICLDSCGGVGFAEFLEVCRCQPPPFLLFLDDINHVKHYQSRNLIEYKTSQEKWKVHAIDERAGWMIAEALG